MSSGTTYPLADCTLEQGDFQGWQALHLRNGLVRLVAIPDIGGRVMAYDLGEQPFLFVDRDLAGKLFSAEENQGDGSLAAWKNYGGDKTWPAPQGWSIDDEWHGPPDPVLDSGHYTIFRQSASAERVQLAMTSPPDTRTGIQITRQITLLRGSTRVQLDLTFTNLLDRTRRWSIWDVVQLDASRQLADGSLTWDPQAVVTVPIRCASRFENGYWIMFGDPGNTQWGVDAEYGLFVANYRWEIGKVGLDSDGGWIAFSRSGYAFVNSFTFFPNEVYPDQGSSVECWTVGSGQVANLDYSQSQIYLMETEVLSPLYIFQPGESHTSTIEWGICHCGGRVLYAAPGGCFSAPLRVETADGRAVLQAVFGVYEPGELIVAWLDVGGEGLETSPLGKASPFEALQLTHSLDIPNGARRLELLNIADVDQTARWLAAVSLD